MGAGRGGWAKLLPGTRPSLGVMHDPHGGRTGSSLAYVQDHDM